MSEFPAHLYSFVNWLVRAANLNGKQEFEYRKPTVIVFGSQTQRCTLDYSDLQQLANLGVVTYDGSTGKGLLQLPNALVFASAASKNSVQIADATVAGHMMAAVGQHITQHINAAAPPSRPDIRISMTASRDSEGAHCRDFFATISNAGTGTARDVTIDVETLEPVHSTLPETPRWTSAIYTGHRGTYPPGSCGRLHLVSHQPLHPGEKGVKLFHARWMSADSQQRYLRSITFHFRVYASDQPATYLKIFFGRVELVNGESESEAAPELA